MGGPYGGNGAGWQETGLKPYRMIRKSVGVDGPPTASMCQNEVVEISSKGDRP
jgi:hypothetical protein